VGEYICNLTRPALQQALYAALPPGTVTCGAPFRGFRLREDGRVEVQFGSGEAAVATPGDQQGSSGSGKQQQEQQAAPLEVTCDLLVGADGLRSAVRACLDGVCTTA
jgi:2-polyprenyl-6-methoxyphenol hydroxylase-like FAD-dependent oxidoreductase